MNLTPQANPWQSQSVPICANTVQRYLRFSGYDPRAAGGRQTLKLELPEDFERSVQQLSLSCHSELLTQSHAHSTLLSRSLIASSHSLTRSPAGLWPPLLLSFSTKAREHGQYPLEIRISYKDAAGDAHLWICTSTILLPRANASLSEIHQVFLATHKNYRVHAEDGAIARLQGLPQGSIATPINCDVDIYAKDAAIAQLDLLASTNGLNQPGQHAVGLSSLAWHELLMEVEVPSSLNLMQVALPTTSAESNPTDVVTESTSATAITSANLIAKSDAHAIPIRLLAKQEWYLGRYKDFAAKPSADICLQYQPQADQDATLGKRISHRHAIIQRHGGRVHITDISRYGILLDGVILEKHQAMPLLQGAHVEFCASFKGLVELRVAAILPHAVVLHRLVRGKLVELFYLLNPEQRPEVGNLPAMLQGHSLFFHRHGQFWHHDALSLQDRVLASSTDLAELHPNLASYRFELATKV
ncbi:FHA domain-containing protein [Undibacterium macrobrachii]|uniref:FHA domain-containing protein n=1 Tax=Undibacterium macrobrachii TaxID=1119058 RepID=A0ABQ2XCP0_9BURK|nr:FHA domain-containing protein [Undibacterium macrobrachii]GGX10127.1 hypothetical protein GCM10011282_15520 [Undibacterium macrobrachii]